ncbi:hypothetical protein IMY05_005G0012800 [Salix suchowensis]|nr:hypothetical protein IMY05_005G0012800 [Salix suchowensis]
MIDKALFQTIEEHLHNVSSISAGSDRCHRKCTPAYGLYECNVDCVNRYRSGGGSCVAGRCCCRRMS